MSTWNDVVDIGSRFRGVEVGTSIGTPALRVGRRLMCRLRTDPHALVLRVLDVGERQALLQGRSEFFFSIPHYDGYPYVLVRLESIDTIELSELIEDAWRLCAPRRLIAEHHKAPGG